MNRVVLGCLLEIIMSIFIIVISIFFWKKIDLSYYAEVARTYADYPVVVNNQ